MDLRRIKNGIGIAHNIEFLPPDLRQIPQCFAPDLRQILRYFAPDLRHKRENACIINYNYVSLPAKYHKEVV